MNYVILGSFFGDEGKGQCVNNICNEFLKQGCTTDQLLVVRFSGANQIGHNVTHNELKHCFRNYGSGSLLGITTYWSEYCVCDLHTLAIETKELQSLGIEPRIIYSPKCELVTPFDVISQWNNEENRKNGTVGTGFKAVLDRVKAGYHLTMMDTKNLLVLREKVWSICKNYYKFESKVPSINIENWIEEVYKMSKNLLLQDFDSIRNAYDHLIFEGSQGILLDQTYGIMPWCTPSNTTCENAVKLLKGDEFKSIYVCRPYITRHGNGPLLTNSKVLDIKDPNNPYNEYQKSFRVCDFDIELLKHSIEINKIFDKHSKTDIVFSHRDLLNKELIQKLKNEFDDLNLEAFEYENFGFYYL